MNNGAIYFIVVFGIPAALVAMFGVGAGFTYSFAMGWYLCVAGTAMGLFAIFTNALDMKIDVILIKILPAMLVVAVLGLMAGWSAVEMGKTTNTEVTLIMYDEFIDLLTLIKDNIKK